MSDFVQVVKSVGILALKTLLSSNPLFQKSEVFGIVGYFAFEYGFFAGHEDVRLCTDPTADIYVTYPHRSLEEFFGSFGFIQALDDGKSVDDIQCCDCKTPIFMSNPLVLKFCLWLLSRQDLGFTHRDESYEKLVSHVVNCIDHEQFDPRAIVGIFPAIDIMKSVKEGNGPELAFFRRILEKCRHINAFHVRRGLPDFKDEQFVHIIDQTDWIFGSLNKEVLDKLTLVSIGDRLPCDDCLKADTLSITIDIEAGCVLLDILLNKYGLCNRNPQVYLGEQGIRDYDICILISKHIKELRLLGYDNTLMASGDIPYCSLFTCLKLCDLDIHPSVPSAISKAVKDGKLPNLRHIELIHLHSNAANWPKVPEFGYIAKDLDLALPNQSDVQKLLSKITCLTLEPSFLTSKHLVNVDRLFTKQLTKLSVLRLIDIGIQCFSNLMMVLRQGKLPNLSELFVSGMHPANDNKNVSDFSLRNFHPKHTPRLVKISLQQLIRSADELRTLSDK